VQRVADVATLPVTGWFNELEGTMYGEADIVGADSTITQKVLGVTNAGTTNFIQIQRQVTSGVVRQNYVVTGAQQANFDSVDVWTADQIKCCALAYRTNDFGAALNGVGFAPDVSGAVASDLSSLTIGHRQTPDQFLNGHVRRIIYWPKRLPFSDLQAITR
jgi:hypothetical protein